MQQRRSGLIAVTQAIPFPMLRMKINPQVVQVQMAGPCIQDTTLIIDSTRHNISHLDTRSSLVHYHLFGFISQAYMYVTIQTK